MNKQVDELMALADAYADVIWRARTTGKEERDALLQALEAALKPGEPVGYRYKFRNFMGDEVWSFELPRDGKVLEAVPVYLEPMPTWQPSDAFRNDAHIAFLHGVIEGQKTAPPAQTCHCKDRPASECPGEWEPGCDLGNNEAHAKPYPPPRLTGEQIVDAIPKVCEPKRLGEVVLDISRAIESAVRRSFGVDDE